MKKFVIILLLFVFASVCNAQKYYHNIRIFEDVTADTIASITSSDSVEIQFDPAGVWTLLTESVNDTALITGDDKIAEQTVIFRLAGEDYWTHTPAIRFRIYSTGVDTITSNWIRTGDLDGACSLHAKPDTSGTDTDYGNTLFTGN